MESGAKCGGCTFSAEPQDQNGQQVVLCKRFPPTVFVFPTQVQKTPANPGGVAIGTQAYFPVMMVSNYCGEYIGKSFIKPS